MRVARENIKLNGVGSIASCAVSDLLKEVPRVEGGYTAVAANIVADVILRMAPELPEYLAEGAVVVASGIIDERAEEVREAMISLGFAVKVRCMKTAGALMRLNGKLKTVCRLSVIEYQLKSD